MCFGQVQIGLVPQLLKVDPKHPFLLESVETSGIIEGHGVYVCRSLSVPYLPEADCDDGGDEECRRRLTQRSVNAHFEQLFAFELGHISPL